MPAVIVRKNEMFGVIQGPNLYAIMARQWGRAIYK
jgi:hypothetical protein